jgi:predicted membrane-bound dolichyl-phosphate-mannose-protein mannosyltransferase
MSRRTAVLVTFLLALENMSFVQAGLAMLDVFSLVFAIASFWLYLKGYYPLVAVFVGLSALAKLYGALAIIPIVLHWLLARRDRQVHFVASLLLAPISFVLLMPLFDFMVFRHFVNPFDRIYTMLSLSGSLTFTNVSHAYKSRPWMWILKPELIPYWYNPNYLGAVSYTIWGLILPSVVYMGFRAIKRVDAALFGLSWFTGTYLMWIPMALVTDRVTYPFYFYPTIGAICIGVGLGISQLIDIWQKRKTGKLRWVIIGAVGTYLVAHILVFAWMTPLSYWWGIPSIFMRK